MIPEDRKRFLGEDARKSAGGGETNIIWKPRTYWDRIVMWHEVFYWIDSYQKRKLRIARKQV